MKTNKELIIELNQKLENEYNLFLYKIEKLSTKEIIAKAYEIVIKDKIKNLFEENDYLNEYQIKGLLSLKNTLNSIYNDWKKGNGIFYIDLEEQSTDFVKYVEEEYLQRLNEEIEDSPNYELIEITSNILQEYSDETLCNKFKNKNKLDNFNIVEINKIINTEEGIKDLYEIFENLKNDEVLDLFTLDNKKYEIINAIILPKLKELEENYKLNLPNRVISDL